MSTIASLRENVRSLLGDQHPDFKQYRNEAIDSTIQTVFSLLAIRGKVSAKLSISTNGLSIEVAGAGDLLPTDSTYQTDWAKIVVNSALKFHIPNAGSYEYSSRSFSERFGHNADHVFMLLMEVYELEASEGGE